MAESLERIDVKLSPAPDARMPLMKSKGGRRRGDTWVVSVFVIIHIGVFIATMLVNDCWTNSHGDCLLQTLGRFSFQPLPENPLLGPSQSKLDEMGALRWILLTEQHQTWRLFTFPFLHGGLFHLLLNLSSIVYVGVRLEREFGPIRIGIIYALSAFVGGLVASLFLRNTPAVGASGPLYGLLGTLLSELVWNWKFHTNKISAIATLVFVFVCNFVLGFLPYVDNFASIGGFISGFLLGSVFLLSPRLQPVAPNKGGLVEYGVKSYINLKLKKKLDRPVLRIVSLILFGLLLAGCLVVVLHGININSYCTWCPYVDCIPFTSWHCKDTEASCETMVSNAQLTMTCIGNGNFRVYPFTNISRARMNDLCNLIC
ncbi:RHOMBOID-like protein 8 [Vigna umbellata]|uniref:RHOMBOID-like protein 8 n=1 Tax=Vigna umbellata TaxID=87088 RepID=UPI001F5E9BDB|nr:RHOMBOID-like protein 8 [Vigna umbellata]